MSQTGRIDCYGLTDIGKVREVNEDQFLIAELNKSMLVHQTSLTFDDDTRWFGGSQGHLLLVADGVGGHAGGKRASTIAVDTVAQYVLNTMPWFFRLDKEHEDDLRDELTSAMERCQASIQVEAEAMPKREGMGTTLTLGYILWPRLYVVHVGDSRCYLLRGRKLEQITTDHTVAQQLIKEGALEAKEAEESRWSNVLWNTVGGSSSELNPEVYKAQLATGDTLLLCTDGITKHLGDTEIAKLLKDGQSAEETCRQLVNAANEAGGSDNIAVVVARFHENAEAKAAVAAEEEKLRTDVELDASAAEEAVAPVQGAGELANAQRPSCKEPRRKRR
jgi:protein phosphatase